MSNLQRRANADLVSEYFEEFKLFIQKEQRSRSTRSYRCCREIEERKLELTLEEIADKFGISVENLKIKK